MNSSVKPIMYHSERARANATFTLLFANFGGNLGDILILESTIDWLRSGSPDCKIQISPLPHRRGELLERQVCDKYENVTVIDPFEARPLPLLPKLEALCPVVHSRAWIPLVYKQILKSAMSCSLARSFRKSDAVLGLGGAHLGDPISALRMLALYEAASRASQKVYLLPQSIPARVSTYVSKLIARGVQNVTEFYAREPASLRSARALGIPNPRLSPDMAFYSRVAAVDKSAPGATLSVGLCVRLTGQRLKKVGIESFLRAYRMLEQQGCKISYFTTHSRDDSKLHERIRARSPEIHLDAPETMEEVYSAISSCDLIISDRLHVLISATQLGVPIIPIMSVQKVRGYIEYVGYPLSSPGLEDLSWDRHVQRVLNRWAEYRDLLLDFASWARAELSSLRDEMLAGLTRE